MQVRGVITRIKKEIGVMPDRDTGRQLLERLTADQQAML
jgi:hypothetical protein